MIFVSFLLLSPLSHRSIPIAAGVEKKNWATAVPWGKNLILLTIWLFNIAMENGPFIDGLPIKNGDFPWLC